MTTATTKLSARKKTDSFTEAEASTGTRTVDSVINFNSDASGLLTGPLGRDIIHDQFIRSSFYLPVEVLKNPNYEIAPLQVMTGEEWEVKYMDYSRQFLTKSGLPLVEIVFCGCTPMLANAAHKVGISVRRAVNSGITYVVVKLWYGN